MGVVMGLGKLGNEDYVLCDYICDRVTMCNLYFASGIIGQYIFSDLYSLAKGVSESRESSVCR
jgi:hypothetical protein